jgi:transposase
MGNLNDTKNIGIDVAKDQLVIFYDGNNSTLSIDNNQSAINQVAQLWQTFPHLERIIVEASGGYEALLLSILAHLQLPVSLVNPKRVRDFAKSCGKLAKTDCIDAQLLAVFGKTMSPLLYQLPDQEQRELAQMVQRRSQLVEMKASEQTRLRQARGEAKASIERHLQWLCKEIEEIDRDMEQKIKQNPEYQIKDQLLQSVSGVGQVTSVVLISQLPELGELSAKQLAALCGLAPFACESGQYKGRRRISGGRCEVRKALYMATIAAIRCNLAINAFYQRLRQAGKPTKVAIIAAARKLLGVLNAMIRDRQSWSFAQA